MVFRVTSLEGYFPNGPRCRRMDLVWIM